jgi:hypothetical protein
MERPLVSRRSWHWREYASFVEGTRASNLPLPPFETSAPANVPPAVLDEARKLYAESENQKDPVKAKDLICKLVSDPRMQSVWKELYRKTTSNDKNSLSDFVNPIFMTNASQAASLRQRASELYAKGGASNILDAKEMQASAKRLEKEKYDVNALVLAHIPWTEQDLGVQLFLWQTYRTALDPKPEYLSEIKAEVKALRKAAQQLRAQVATLQSLRVKCDALEQIASDCDSRARSRDVNPKTDDAWIITRRVRRFSPEQKTFAAILSGITSRMCRKPMYGTIATITNVVFETNLNASNIRELLR